MPQGVRRLARVAALALLWMGLAPAASADFREFTGVIREVTSGDAATLRVDNGKGAVLAFARAPDAEVRGRKSAWDELAPDDWVTVSWKLIDKPRKAHVIVVLPPREE